MASVKLKGVYKRYPGGVTAVNDFNLDIEDKELLYCRTVWMWKNYNIENGCRIGRNYGR